MIGHHAAHGISLVQMMVSSSMVVVVTTVPGVSKLRPRCRRRAKSMQIRISAVITRMGANWMSTVSLCRALSRPSSHGWSRTWQTTYISLKSNSPDVPGSHNPPSRARTEAGNRSRWTSSTRCAPRWECHCLPCCKRRYAAVSVGSVSVYRQQRYSRCMFQQHSCGNRQRPESA